MTDIRKSADLPNEKAFEPDEDAHQPSVDENMPPLTGPNTSKKLAFAKDVDFTEKLSSQTSSSFKDVLSQPASSMSHAQKLLWLQKRRIAGLWAQCDKCDRWRYLPHIIDRHELPKKWYCSMNPDRSYASCSVPEAPLRLREEEDLIHSVYTAGSLVWAHLAGWPWWPAMVDDCPDTEQFYWLDGFSDIPTHYNVVFFDNLDVTRAWISPENLKPYAYNKNVFKNILKDKINSLRFKAAISQADEAESMTISNRLDKFSFISRYRGNINSPKKVNINDLKKYQRRIKKKFNVEFPIETSSSEEENMHLDKAVKNGNVIFLGTPKRPKKNKTIPKRRLTDHNIEKVVDSALNNEEEQNSTLTDAQNPKEDSNTEKPPNSMAVQVGSTEAATTVDNDTSSTYLPVNRSEDHEHRDEIETPNSDDFEF